MHNQRVIQMHITTQAMTTRHTHTATQCARISPWFAHMVRLSVTSNAKTLQNCSVATRTQSNAKRNEKFVTRYAYKTHARSSGCFLVILFKVKMHENNASAFWPSIQLAVVRQTRSARKSNSENKIYIEILSHSVFLWSIAEIAFNDLSTTKKKYSKSTFQKELFFSCCLFVH